MNFFDINLPFDSECHERKKEGKLGEAKPVIIYLRYKKRILKYSLLKYFAGMILYFSLGNKYHRKLGRKRDREKEKGERKRVRKR